MKCTQYFLFIKKRPDRAIIKEEWILETINNPLKTKIQSDGRVRKWSYVEEAGKYLRVILLEDGETIITPFSIEVLRRNRHENSLFCRYRYGAH